MSNRAEERNQDATVYIGNVDEKVTESLLWELMLQAGPVVNVHLPKDRIMQQHQGYGFVEFMTEEDAEYAIKIMNMIKLYGRPIRVNKATSEKRNLDIGATLFVGNLSPSVDEKLLYDTLSVFGLIIQTPNIVRVPHTGVSKGYGFITFESFDAADAAISAMNGQFLMNKPISVSYAFKKDGKGEKHGSAAERLLAARSKKSKPPTTPNRMFQNVPFNMIPSPMQPVIPITAEQGFAPPPPPFTPPFPSPYGMDVVPPPQFPYPQGVSHPGGGPIR